MTLNSRFADYNGLVSLAFPSRFSMTSRGYRAGITDDASLTRIAPGPLPFILSPTIALNTLSIGLGVDPAQAGSVNILGFGVDPATYTSGDPMMLVADTLDANTVGVETEHEYVTLVDVTLQGSGNGGAEGALLDIPITVGGGGGGTPVSYIGVGTNRSETSLAVFPPLSIGLIQRWTVRVPPNAPGPCALARLMGNRQSYTFGSFEFEFDNIRDIQPGQTVVREYSAMPLRHNGDQFNDTTENGGVWVEAIAEAAGTTDVETTVELFSTTQRQFLQSGT